jgi:hypothetical protein
MNNTDISKFNKNTIKNNSNKNIIIYFICFILLIVVGYGIYRYFTKGNSKKPVKIMNLETITRQFQKKADMAKIQLPQVDKGDVLGISLGFKIFIDNAMENEKWGNRFDQLKPIINYSPGVFYHPQENYLEFIVDVKDNIQFNTKQSIKYDQPPLQKWLSIIAVFTSTKIMIYSNGELVVNKKLKNPPIFKSDDLYIGEKNNNIKGQLGPVIYWSYPLDSSEINKATRALS